MILLEIDPNVVKPGWTPLIILVILAGAVVLLYISLRRQMGKINVPGSTYADVDDEPVDQTQAETVDETAAEVEPAPEAPAPDDAPRPSSTPTG